MKELSIFIDESGDFGEITERPAYYLVTLLFHDQKNDIASNVKKLEDSTKNSGFDFEYIHTGPVIRREDVFSGLSIDERRKLLFKMLNFIASSPISYELAVVNRKEASDLNTVFLIHFSNVEFRKAEPQKYRLLQAADFICSMELLKIKRDQKRLSRSEEQFFHKPQELKKTFLKSIEKKKL